MKDTNKMRWLKKDRLTAVNALRRVRAPATPETATEDFNEQRDRLAEMVGATIERNRFGEFLRVRRWLPDPVPCGNPEALGLVLRPPLETGDLADPERWLFLDTETTGLAGGTGTCAFLVGLAWWERGGLAIEQLFLRDYDEEHAVLLALAEHMEERPVLVTYNGKSFDWPLLETRFRLTRQIEAEPPRAHMDLLHPARQLWRLQLGTARLAEIERLVLGIERGPDILSALIPQLYFDYLRGRSPEPLVPVFHHNQGDLAGLAALTGHVLVWSKSPSAPSRSSNTDCRGCWSGAGNARGRGASTKWRSRRGYRAFLGLLRGGGWLDWQGATANLAWRIHFGRNLPPRVKTRTSLTSQASASRHSKPFSKRANSLPSTTSAANATAKRPFAGLGARRNCCAMPQESSGNFANGGKAG